MVLWGCISRVPSPQVVLRKQRIDTAAVATSGDTGSDTGSPDTNPTAAAGYRWTAAWVKVRPKLPNTRRPSKVCSYRVQDAFMARTPHSIADDFVTVSSWGLWRACSMVLLPVNTAPI